MKKAEAANVEAAAPVTVSAEAVAPAAAKRAAKAKGPGQDERVTYVYIGPSIPGGKIQTSGILTGTQASIDAYLADMMESYPEIAHLLFTPDKLADAMKKVQQRGNILNKYYSDIRAKVLSRRMGG